MPQFENDLDLGVRILAKRDALLRKRERLLRLAKAMDVCLAQVDGDLDECLVAGRVVGMKVPLPDWDRVLKTSLRSEMERVERVLYDMPEETGFEREDGYWRVANELVEIAGVADYPSQPPPATPSLRQIVLERLQAAGKTGTKSGAIRAYARELLGDVFHEKTVTMTLNRLAKEGLARREGRLWFRIYEESEELSREPVEVGADEPEEEVSIPEEERRFFDARIRMSGLSPEPSPTRHLHLLSSFARRQRLDAERARAPFLGMIVRIVRTTVRAGRQAAWRKHMKEQAIQSLATAPGLVALLPGKLLSGTDDRTFCMISIFDKLESLSAQYGDKWNELGLTRDHDVVEKRELENFEVYA